MGRPAKVSTDSIIASARALFLDKGFHATTAVIADRAGDSEGSLLNRCKDKLELFMAAMDLPHPTFLDALPALVGRGDARANLEKLAGEIIAFVETALPKIVTLISHKNLLRGRAIPADSPPVRVIRAVTGYFAAEVARGRMHAADPEVAARLFVGSAWHYCLFQMMSRNVLPLGRNTFVRGMVDQLWQGLAPRAAA